MRLSWVCIPMSAEKLQLMLWKSSTWQTFLIKHFAKYSSLVHNIFKTHTKGIPKTWKLDRTFSDITLNHYKMCVFQFLFAHRLSKNTSLHTVLIVNSIHPPFWLMHLFAPLPPVHLWVLSVPPSVPLFIQFFISHWLVKFFLFPPVEAVFSAPPLHCFCTHLSFSFLLLILHDIESS